MPQFTTDRFLVRALRQSDIRFIHQGLSNPRVVRYLDFSCQTVEDAQRQFEWYENLVKDEKGQWFAIMSLDDDTFYGACGFSNWDKQNKTADIGIWILQEYWQRGIMREVYPPLCTWGYRVMQLFRIQTTAEYDNDRYIHSIEEVHFHHEGTLRSAKIKGDQFIHVRLYSRLVIDDTRPIIPKRRKFI